MRHFRCAAAEGRAPVSRHLVPPFLASYPSPRPGWWRRGRAAAPRRDRVPARRDRRSIPGDRPAALIRSSAASISTLFHHGEILGHVARVRDHACFWSVNMLAFAWSYKQINGCYFEKYFGCRGGLRGHDAIRRLAGLRSGNADMGFRSR